MKELVVISGKGGTGKTSIVASFAALARNMVLADCDVDAADLHLVLEPKSIEREIFKAGKKARIMKGHCTACGKCEEVCVFDAVYYDGPGNGKVEKTFRIDPIACEGCGVCFYFCDYDAIEFKEAECGHWFVSETRFGPMVHAKLGVAEENSGKLVTLVRKEARDLALKYKKDLLIIDGPPGIGCPVIASVTGVDMVLVVTEPTMSGFHDLKRVRELTRHFDIPTFVCVNKYDINPELTSQIEIEADKEDSKVIGKVRYDPSVTKAQIKGLSVVEYTNNGVSEDIRSLWDQVLKMMNDER